MKKILALCVGLNNVDATKYNGWDGELRYPHKDANDVRNKLALLDANVYSLYSGEATFEALVTHFNHFALVANEYELLVFYLSGHGISIKANPLSEADGTREGVVLYDTPMMDHVLRSYLDKISIPKLVILDTCYSGGMNKYMMPSYGRARATKAMPKDVAQFVFDNTFGKTGLPPVQKAANTCFLTACKSSEVAYDGTVNQPNSLFTYGFLMTSAPTQLGKRMDTARKICGKQQTPQMIFEGCTLVERIKFRNLKLF